MGKTLKRLTSFILLILLLAACGPTQEAISTMTAEAGTLVAETWTETPTHTPTFTPTWTPTNTPTKTVTPTLTPTSTPTVTPTSTPTVMNTPTFTVTPLPTITNTATPTLEPIATSDPSRWERYQPRTLREIIAETKPLTEIIQEDSFYLNFGYDYASEVTVTYTGEFRMISEDKLFFLELWGADVF